MKNLNEHEEHFDNVSCTIAMKKVNNLELMDWYLNKADLSGQMLYLAFDQAV